jgi:hypothetical protein
MLPEESMKLRNAASMGMPGHIAMIAFGIPALKNSIIKLFLQEISNDCQTLCTRKRGMWPTVYVMISYIA